MITTGDWERLVEDEREQIEYFKRMEDGLRRRFAGKVIAIANGEVVGVGDEEDEALEQAKKKYPKRAIHVVSFGEKDLLVHGIV